MNAISHRPDPIKFLKAVHLYREVNNDPDALAGWDKVVSKYKDTGILDKETEEHMTHVWWTTSLNLATWYNPNHPVYQKLRLDGLREKSHN